MGFLYYSIFNIYFYVSLMNWVNLDELSWMSPPPQVTSAQ